MNQNINSTLQSSQEYHLEPLPLDMRSRGTHGRDHFNPLGNVGDEFVATGNLLACRCILLIYLAVSKGCCFVLEQPDGSAFPLHPRWQELLMDIKVSCFQKAMVD